jgi:hypothetical protein
VVDGVAARVVDVAAGFVVVVAFGRVVDVGRPLVVGDDDVVVAAGADVVGVAGVVVGATLDVLVVAPAWLSSPPLSFLCTAAATTPAAASAIARTPSNTVEGVQRVPTGGEPRARPRHDRHLRARPRLRR